MASGSAPDLVTVLVNSSTLAAFAIAAALVGISVIARRVWPEHFSPWRIAAGAALLTILAVTQLPTRPLNELADLELTGSISKVLTWPFDGVDVEATFRSSGWWLNIVLFVPLGICVRGLLQRRRAWVSVGLVAVTAYVVESGQAFTGFRSPDLADFLANTAGGAIGCAVFSVLRPTMTRVEPHRPTVTLADRRRHVARGRAGDRNVSGRARAVGRRCPRRTASGTGDPVRCNNPRDDARRVLRGL